MTNQDKTTIISNTKVKQTARGLRIWIEGGNLAKAGFLPKSKYNLNMAKGNFLISLKDDGIKTVSGCSRDGKPRPVIDIHSKELANYFNAGDCLRVEYYSGMIAIAKEG